MLLSCLVNSGRTQEFELVLKGRSADFPSARFSERGAAGGTRPPRGGVVLRGYPGPRGPAAREDPSTERLRAGLSSPAQAAGAVPAASLPPDFPSSTHEADLRLFPDFYLIFFLIEVVALFAMAVVQTGSGSIETDLSSSKV